MTNEPRALLRKQLIRDEGIRLKPYRCTAGKLTIGVGRNLDDVGLTEDEALALLDHDIDRCILQLAGAFPWFASLDVVRQRVLVNLCFNLGLPRLSTFVRMLAALERRDFTTAAAELRDSKWYSQVGTRGPRLVASLASGTDAG